MPRTAYEPLDDAAIDRIMKGLDTSSNDYQKIRRELIKKHPGWSQTQRTKFALGIINRKIELETPISRKQAVLKRRTTLTGSGFGAKRQTMIRDNKGRYLGRPENLKIYIRHGNVWGKNKLTGKSARLS